MSRRSGREQSWNDYWEGEPKMQLPKEYDDVPMGREATYDKLNEFERKRKERQSAEDAGDDDYE